jgi:4-oxalocrotonate tautomerase
MVAIEAENLRELTFVLIEDVKQGDWGVGGKALTAADVQWLQRAVAA